MNADHLETDLAAYDDQRARYLDPPLYVLDRPVTIELPAGCTLDLTATRFELEGAGQLRFDLGDGARVVGIVDVRGALLTGSGAAPPSNRTVRDPIVLVSGHRARFDGFRVQNALGWGVKAEGHLIGADLGDCTFLDCGVGWHPSRPHYGGQAVVALRGVDETPGRGLGSPVQTAQMSANGDAAIEDGAILQFGATFHQVKALTGGGGLDVYPWASIGTPYDIPTISQFWQGGGLRVSGNNTAQLRVRSLSAYRCAIGVHDLAVYGARIDAFTAEATGLGYVYGNQAPNAVPLGARIDGWHPEATYRAGVCCALAGRAWIEHTVVPVSRPGRFRPALEADGYRMECLVPVGGGARPWPFLSTEGS